MAFIILFIAICILLIALKVTRSLSPVRYFVLMWVAQIVVAFLFRDQLRLEYWGLGYIEIALCCTIMGSWLMEFYCPKESKQLRRQIKQKSAFLCILGLVFLGFLQPLQVMREQGGLTLLMNINDLLEANNNAAVERYNGGGTERGLLASILLSITYTAPLYGGYIYRAMDRKGRFLSVFSIFPGILIALTQAVKMALITSVILWISGFLTYMLYHKISMPKISFKLLLRASCVIGIFIGILFFSMMLRTGRLDGDIVNTIQRKFISYSIGQIPCFDQWFSDMHDPRYTYGGLTIAGIANYVGLVERKQGIFQETYQVWSDNSGQTTNIYTVFRMIIEDFGYVGSLMFFIFLGMLTSIVRKNILVDRNSIGSQIIMMGIWAFVLWSFVTSFFAYTSYCVMLVFMYILLYYTSAPDSNETITKTN